MYKFVKNIDLRLLRKISYYFTVITISVIAGGIIAVYIYKDRIINLLVEEVNTKLKTQLEVDLIDISLFKGFPNVAVVFNGVNFHSTFKNESLVVADKVYCLLNVLELLNKDILIEKITIDKGSFIVHTDKFGNKNYDVFVNRDASNESSAGLTIRSIEITNSSIKYLDDPMDIDMLYTIENLDGAASLENDIVDVYVQSTFEIPNADMDYLYWAIGKKIKINTRVIYKEKYFEVSSSELRINNAYFRFKGELDFENQNTVALNFDGENNKFLDLVTLLPVKLQTELAPYNGNGIIDFNAKLNGVFSNKSLPQFEATIKLTDFEINHEQFKETLHSINLDGDILIKDLSKLETGTLILAHSTASVKNRTVSFSGSINNFTNPQIKGYVLGDIDMPWLVSIIKTTPDSLVTGSLGLNLNVDISLTKVKDSWSVTNNALAGSLKLTNISFNPNNVIYVQNLFGSLSISGDNLSINDVSGKIESSDFVINGSILKPLSLFNNESIGILEANLDIKSNKLNLDELVDKVTQLSGNNAGITANQFNDYKLDLNLVVDYINLKRFEGAKLKAGLEITPQKLSIHKITFFGLGGQIMLFGNISNMFNDDVFVEANVRTNGIKLDRLFSVFNNFNQDFILDTHLKGNLNANIYTYMYFDSSLKFKRELLYSEGELTILNGELNNFKPIMELAPYLKNDEEKLSKLQFSDINSKIIISRDTVFLSDMYVNSNVRNIKVGGYHTLDQHINYRLSVPVINNKRDKDEAFGEVRTDSDGGMYWPFRIKGTTEDYKVIYDFKRASSNLVKGVKRDLFSNKSKSDLKIMEDSLLLEEDEFFDWEEND